MKAYDTLTRLGRIRRLRTIALKALDYYDLDVKVVSFLTTETNTMFHVRTGTGGRYVIRIYTDEHTTLRENQAEMYWLNAIKRDTDLKVTEPIPRRDGTYISVVSAQGVPGERRCVLFNWIPGRPLENDLSPDKYFKYGRILAKLHNHASSLKPLPPEIQPKKWDKVFYYPDEPVIYNDPEYSHLFPPERIQILDEVIRKANVVFEVLFADQEGQILIHGDLHYWNIHYHRGELYVIDFEDINLGYPVQDVAVSLSYGQQREGYHAWKDAFKQGYCSIRRWPVENEETIATLIAARSVMFINYVARIDPSPEAYIKERCGALATYLKTYGQ